MSTQIEGQVMEVIAGVGVDVDKEELLKAIAYDRDQYHKGFEDGYNNAIDKALKLIEQYPINYGPLLDLERQILDLKI